MNNIRHTFAVAAIALIALSGANANAALLAFDDFSKYNDGLLNGATPTESLTGFGTNAWTYTSSNTTGSINSGQLLTPAGNATRNAYHQLTSGISSGTVYIRVNMALANGGGQNSLLTFASATSDASNTDFMRLAGGTNLGVVFLTTGTNRNTGGVSSGAIVSNDGNSHEWLVELDFTNGTGQAWIDADLGAFDTNVAGAGFTLPNAFAINYLRVQTAGPSNQVTVDDVQIGMSLQDVGVAVLVPTPAALPAGFALLGLIAIRRRC